MTDYFEIDFMDVESAKSGDAIPLRYCIGEKISIHVVDGGFQATGDAVVGHIKKYYGNPHFIDRVIVTHPDGDHAGGLRTVLEEFTVGELWMLRPWLYADELIDRFSTYESVDRLRSRLKTLYPNLAALEAIAEEQGIPIREPFQGAILGAFTVMAPAKARYLDLIVESDRTPESVEETMKTTTDGLAEMFKDLTAKAVAFLKAAWGVEVFSPNETSAENNMSVIQYAYISNHKILLTGDAGRSALNEAADYAPMVGLTLPGIDRFQVPHHGSRRNVSTETLDRWLGTKLVTQLPADQSNFTALISSAKADTHHPRKAVVRALIHRGAKVSCTEGQSIRTSHNAPTRDGWTAAPVRPYPDENEE